MFSPSQRRLAKDGPSVEVQPGHDESHPSSGAALWSVQMATDRETSRGSFPFPRGILRLHSEQSGAVVPPPTASRPTRPAPRFGVIFQVPPKIRGNGVAGEPIAARQHSQAERAGPRLFPVAQRSGISILAALAGAVLR